MKINYGGDAAVTCVSLYMAILRAYAVNAKDIPWDERLVYHLTNILWFKSY